MFDRASGDFRLFQMLKILAEKYETLFCGYATDKQIKDVGADETLRYKKSLQEIGVEVTDPDPLKVLIYSQFDVVLFEFYFAAQRYLGEARVLQKHAVMVIDSVDVAYSRFMAKAKLTRKKSDLRSAIRTRRLELRNYRRADYVIAITDEDQRVLQQADPAMRLGVVPNMHPVQPMGCMGDGSEREPNTLLFVGNFLHQPNVDAVLFFCEEVLPLIWKTDPSVKLRVIGAPVLDRIRALACDRIEILGHVPDIEIHLRRSKISIAPLRYGGGMKGKVGEALAAGLPVVTTAFGAEGFGLVSGRDLLVASSPQEFSEAVIKLLHDPDFYNSIRNSGWKFINENYSVEAVSGKFIALMEKMANTPRRKLTTIERLYGSVPSQLRHTVCRLNHRW